MSIEAGDFKTGLTLLIDGNIFQVLDFQHVKPGKGAAFLKTKLKNLRNGNIVERTFNTTVRFEQAIIEKKAATFSYDNAGIYCFMDSETYEMYELSEDQVGFAKNFIIEGSTITIKFFEEEIFGIEIPEKVALKVTETSDAVAGNTATNATKDAILETGLLVRVPLFIKEGDSIVVSTADGKYDRRAA